MNDLEKFEPNNEEEAEIAQILALQTNTAAVDQVRRHLEAQRLRPSAEFCEDCGEDIPEARRLAIPGVQFCIHCQAKLERFKANYRQPGANTE